MAEFNRYVEPSYIPDEYFTRSDDNTYVADDYYDTGYTVYTADAFTDLQATAAVSAAATVVPGVSITLNITGSIPTAIATKVVFGSATSNTTANLSSTPIRQRTSTATLTHAGDDVQWQFADTWAEPKQETWRKRVVVSANRVLYAPSKTFDINTNFTAAGISTRTHSATVNITSDIDSGYVRIRPATNTSNATATLSARGIAARLGNATLNITAAQSSLGQAQFFGTTTLNAAVTTLSAFGRIRPFSTINAGSFNCSVSANPTKSGVFSENIRATSSATPTRITPFRATLNSTLTQNSSGISTRTGASTQNIQSNNVALGGKLIGIANEILPITSTQTSSGLILTVDPLRLVRVLPETRTKVVETETRATTVLAETRTRSVDTENRGLIVLPESRIKPALEEI